MGGPFVPTDINTELVPSFLVGWRGVGRALFHHVEGIATSISLTVDYKNEVRSASVTFTWNRCH